MADEPEQPDSSLPPPTEQIHLPEPSYLPVFVAFGITIALVGVILSWVVFAIGILIFLVATVRWIRSAREEMAGLPLDH